MPACAKHRLNNETKMEIAARMNFKAPQPKTTESPAILTEAEELALFKETLALTNTIICRWDLHTNGLVWTANAHEILAYGTLALPSIIDGWIATISDEDRARFAQLKTGLLEHARPIDMEYTLEPHGTKGIKFRLRHIGKIALDDKGKPAALISTITASRLQPDTLPKDESDNGLAYLSHGLPDRRSSDRRGYHYPSAFMKHLQDAIEHSKRTHEHGTFMLLAINNLAMIINGYGFDASEEVLKEIKRAISRGLNPHDKVERIHRDQLGIVLANCDRKGAERQAAEFRTIIQNLSSRADVGPLHVTCAIGSVGFPEPASSVAEALDKAYIALNNNQNVIYSAFEETENNQESSRKQMAQANQLMDAMKQSRLRLAFQPIIASKTGECAHYECLLRMVDDKGKITSAGPLIPVAERMGLIETIDRFVVEKVVEELKLHPTVSLAFNISNVTTGNPEWVRFLAKLLNDDTDVAGRMIVEITETAAQRDLRETAYFVASVQALGCQVSLDDFGSGYTSFRQLKALSVDMLKIDGAFIRDIIDNPDNRFFVKTLLDFTNGYGLKAVAEYVETGEVAKLLMELGVEYMQGYYFSQPLNYRPWLNEGEFTPS